MKTRNARWLLLMLLMLVCMDMQAQIPQQVTEVMRKCQKKMENPAGVEMDMNIHVGMMIFSMNGTMKMMMKGEKSFYTISMKLLGQEMLEEVGFDGTQEWEFTGMPEKLKKNTKKPVADTLTITQVNRKAKGDYDLEFDLDKDYNKAEMKVKGPNYVITFTQPKEKDAAKQIVMKINKDNYYFYELSSKEKGVTMRMTATKIKVGVSDHQFKFDLNRYPGAVIIRK